MALDTVQDYVTRARDLLQDTVEEFRFSDAFLVGNLNEAFLEARKLRPDLMAAYFRTAIPTYSATAMGTAVAMDEQYRVPFVYYIAGRAQLIDDENTTDTRAAAFLNLFTTKLSSLV